MAPAVKRCGVLLHYRRCAQVRIFDNRCAPDWRNAHRRPEPSAAIENNQKAIRPSNAKSLDQSIDALSRVDRRFTEAVELRYFAGCSLEEIAKLTDRSLATVKRDWAYARAWLYDYIQGSGERRT